MADTFVASQFFRLHNLIQRAVAAPSSSAGTSNEWYIAVDGLRNQLVDLGRVKAGDDAQIKEVEAGKITLGSTTHSLNADFASLTTALATNLGFSTRYCASLLQDALASRSRYPSRSPIEIALVLHQRERWALTEAWKDLVSAAVTLPQEQDVAHRKLGLKMSQALQALLGIKVSYSDSTTQRREVSLPQRILLEIDSLKAQAASIENALRNPPTAPNRRLPDELQLERISSLGQERRAWAHVLYLLAISAMLQGEEILAMAKWLSKVKEDEAAGLKEDLMPYVLTALLAALETSTKASLEGLVGPGQPDLLDDRSSLSQMDSLINKSSWASTSLQAVVQLQWSLLLVEVVRHDASLGSELHVSDDSVSKAVFKAIQQGDAFVYIVLRLLGWRQRLFDAIEGTEDEDVAAASSTQAPSSKLGVDAEDEIDVEFQSYLLSSLHTLLVGVSRTFLSLLRKLQRQEEDAAYSVQRPGSKDVRRYDLEAFLDALALVVRGDASRSLPFWLTPEGRRSRFVMWAVELREEGHQRALLDLLSAMSTGGNEGAWQAHALLSSSSGGGAESSVTDDGLISWNRLWDWMAYYIDALRSGGGDRERASMPPGESTLLRSFLRLLRSVVAGSFAAREAILALTLSNATSSAAPQANPFGLPTSAGGGAGTSALQRLFALYVCPIPIELKATLLDTMAAFAREGPAAAGTATTSGRLSRVRQELWSLVESSGILSGPQSSRNAAAARFGGLGGGFRSAQSQPSDVLFELENVEASSGLYPGTISFINFLSSLIVPDVVGPGGRAAGDVSSLVADLPLAAPMAQPSLPLGVPQSTGSAAAQGQADIGLEKYISFVVDAVLLPSISTNGPRDFAVISEKWRLVSSCLHFLNRCLSAFDLASLTRNVGPSGAGPRGAEDRETLMRLSMHPGFGVMKRLMGSSKLLKEILGLLSPNLSGSADLASTAAGFEVVDSPAAKRSAIFLPSAVATAMRIILTAIKGQGLFLSVLLPTLAGLSDSMDTRGAGSSLSLSGVPGFDLETRIGQSAAYSTIDSKMLQEYESVIQIALYINSTRDDLALLSVKLLTEVANGAAFSEVDRFADGSGGAGRRRMNRLVGLLEMTEETGRVREGVVRRLDALSNSDDEGDAVPRGAGLLDDDEGSEEQLLGVAGPSSCGNSAVCRAIIDLLLIGTASNKHAPNIAHLLLGYDLRAIRADDQVIPAPGPDSPRGALHALLDLLRGDRDLADDEAAEALDQGMPALLETHPALAERTLALFLNLCTHSYTTSCTLRYLRTQEDFWAQQLRSNFFAYMVPVERDQQDGAGAHLARGQLVFADGRSIQTSVDALISSLDARQHLLSGIAIELHGLVTAGMQTQAAHLVGALYGAGLVLSRGDIGEDIDAEDSGEDFMQTTAAAAEADRNVGMRLLTLLQSFDFEWHDERDGLASNLVLLRDLDISQAKAATASVATSTREFDIPKTIALLAFARRELERMGELGDARRRANFDAEAAVVLQHVSARNAHRAVAKCRRAALTSWRNVQDLVLSHASFLLRQDAQPLVVFDSLSALLPRLDGAAPEEDPILADLAAGAILSLLTSLRRHRAQLVAGASSLSLADELPVDRLVSTLTALTGAILRAGTSVSARGNLYSALINYLQLVRASTSSKNGDGGLAPGEGSGDSILGEDSFSLADGESYAAGSTFGGASTFSGDYQQQQPSALDVRTRAFLAQHAERLIPILARDALDAPDVWRTVALTLLDRLCALEASARGGRSGRSPVVLDILSRGGFLKSFVARLRDMDVSLQAVLRPDPPTLNALYVYESKLAFFARLAQSRRGAERLLEAKIFDVFSQADFLAARPEEDQDFVDLESFLPAATERYAALLLPALQVAVAVVQATSSSQRARAPILGGTAQSAASTDVAQHSAHGSATSRYQALALLNAHRDSLLAVLRSAVQDTVSLSIVDEAHLVVTLMLQVLPVIDDDALAPPRPLAAYHSAILQLAAGFLHSTAWKGRVLPFTEAEREEEATPAKGGGSEAAVAQESAMDADDDERGVRDEESAFDVRVSQAVARLVFSVSSYLEAASETVAHRSAEAASGIRPCLSSSLAVPQPYSAGSRRRDGRTPFESYDHGSASMRRSRGPAGDGGGNLVPGPRVASVPSLGIALAAMDEQVAALERELPLADRMRAMLDEGENVALQEWQNLAAATAGQGEGQLDLTAGLSMQRRSALVSLRLSQMRGKATQRLDVVDVLLVVIQRHFAYYLAALDEGGDDALAGSGAPKGVDAGYAAPWMGGSSGRAKPNAGYGNNALVASADGTSLSALLDDGAQMVQLVLERLGRVLLTVQRMHGADGAGGGGGAAAAAAADGPSVISNARERSTFLEVVGRKLQTMLLVTQEAEERDGRQ